MCLQKPPPGPRRESLRNKGIAADGTFIDDERRGGKVLIGRGEVSDPGPWVKAEDPPPPKARFPKGDLPAARCHAVLASCFARLQDGCCPGAPAARWTGHILTPLDQHAHSVHIRQQPGFGLAQQQRQQNLSAKLDQLLAVHAGPVEFTSKNGSERIDKQMLALVGGISGSGKKKASVKQIAGFNLEADGVAKVSHAGISHLSFHPGTSHLLLATGALLCIGQTCTAKHMHALISMEFISCRSMSASLLAMASQTGCRSSGIFAMVQEHCSTHCMAGCKFSQTTCDTESACQLMPSSIDCRRQRWQCGPVECGPCDQV